MDNALPHMKGMIMDVQQAMYRLGLVDAPE